ncbi:MAG: hypothetical protein ACE5JH_06275 [Acidobacteriota bacterium]
MSATRAHQAQRFLKEEPPFTEPLYTVRAGEEIVIRIGALDRKSGVAEIIACCRSRENHDLHSTGRWSSGTHRTHPVDNYYPVVVPIPRHSPSVVWEVHRITLCDAEGNRRSYRGGTDFEEMLFRVEELEGVDCTPPRLLGVRFGRA